MTTDSHVIQPAFFPGGDIGRLVDCGTVNDLAMMGATEVLGLTCSVILEEGFPRARSRADPRVDARRVRRGGAPRSLTGDTKVMGKGEIDGIVINTTGVALTVALVRDCRPAAGDRIIVTGTLGDHGMAVMAARHGSALERRLCVSDVAPINGLIRAALAAAARRRSRAMKDPTRGGVASALHEMASKSRVGICSRGGAAGARRGTRRSSELVGIDPLLVANEGKAVIGVRPTPPSAVLARAARASARRAMPPSSACAPPTTRAWSILDTGFGRRLLAEPEGELLPRIC